MTTLREEIEAYHRENFDDTPEWTAKVILKMIEKRIDEMITDCLKKNGSEIREHGNHLHFRLMYTEQIDILNKVKEMLSK